MRLVFLCWLLISAATAQAAETGRVTLHVTVPDGTPAGAELALGAAFNGWNPVAGKYGFSRTTNGVFIGTLPEFPADKMLLFKVTRGSWESGELAADGSQLDNRRYTVLPGEQTLKITVAAWADQSETPPLESTAVVEILEEIVELPTYAGHRSIYIYVPSDYHDSDRRYPVIYMTDGRNLFDESVGAMNEWGLDELMEQFVAEGSPLASIVVGIDHAGDNRGNEYNPWDSSWAPLSGEGRGAEWADWLVETFKPSIDARYRTLAEREHTTIMGSSMGGLIACYTAIRHQAAFYKAGCYSPAFVEGLVGSKWRDYIKATGRQYPMRIHMDMGDAEFDLFGADILQRMSAVEATMLNAGFGRDEIRNQVIADGVHNEKDWRERTEDIIRWLNGPHEH